jgi:hypothetical protein
MSPWFAKKDKFLNNFSVPLKQIIWNLTHTVQDHKWQAKFDFTLQFWSYAPWFDKNLQYMRFTFEQIIWNLNM